MRTQRRQRGGWKYTTRNTYGNRPQSPEEQARLVDLISKGRKAEGYGPEAEAARKAGIEARNEYVLANLSLVAKCLYYYPPGGWHDRDDLLQEGADGLRRAVETYDPKKGKFSNYAFWWIRHYMNVYACKDHLICYEKSRDPNAFRPIVTTLTDLGLDERVLSDRGKDGLFVDPEKVDPCERMYMEELQQVVAGCLRAMEPRWREVVVRRRGIGCREEKLAEVARSMNISRERVRQIQSAAEALLKKSIVSRYGVQGDIIPLLLRTMGGLAPDDGR